MYLIYQKKFLKQTLTGVLVDLINIGPQLMIIILYVFWKAEAIKALAFLHEKCSYTCQNSH